MKREAYHRLKYHQYARNLLLLVIILIISTNMVVAEGVSAANNLRIVSNGSSLVDDYMEVDGGEESPPVWEIGGLFISNNGAKGRHIGYPATRNRGPAVCDAKKYQSCLPSRNNKGPTKCRSFHDRTSATLLLLLLTTTAAADDLGRKCGGSGAECAAARGGGNEEMWMMEPEGTRGFINPVTFQKYHSICYDALRIGPICFAPRIGGCFGERKNLKRNCDYFNRSCLRG
nr:uncharacterized protein LOC109180232 [Ipomoea batatas]